MTITKRKTVVGLWIYVLKKIEYNCVNLKGVLFYSRQNMGKLQRLLAF